MSIQGQKRLKPKADSFLSKVLGQESPAVGGAILQSLDSKADPNKNALCRADSKDLASAVLLCWAPPAPCPSPCSSETSAAWHPRHACHAGFCGILCAWARTQAHHRGHGCHLTSTRATLQVRSAREQLRIAGECHFGKCHRGS